MDYFERKLDDKNRLTIPSELQAELGSEVVVTPGFGQYLHLYPRTVWDADMETALKGDILDERIADLNVKFRMGKSSAKLDAKQGRITLEAHQMALLGNTRSVMLVRAGSYWRVMPKA